MVRTSCRARIGVHAVEGRDRADGTGSHESGHPCHAHLARFQSLLAATALETEVAQRSAGASHTELRALMRIRPTPDRGWRLKWLYLSHQFRDGSMPARFQALTVLYSRKQRQIERYEFPDDPCLTTAAAFLRQHSTGNPGVEVLRYVPRMRLTFKTATPAGMPVVGKFMRRPDLAAAYGNLTRVFRAASASRATFSVAAPAGLDEEHGVFFQEAKPGRDLSAMLDRTNFRRLLRAVGAIHGDIHALDVPDVPEWDFAAFVQSVTSSIESARFLMPEQAPFFGAAHDLVLERMPRVTPADYAFCHGDFRCSQVLNDGEDWAVVDFDAALRCDPCLEIARFVTSLRGDVPLFAEDSVAATDAADDLLDEAEESYLAGYRERSRRVLDPQRLSWYRLCCEVQYLARMIQKGLVSPIAFERTMAALRTSCDRLRRGIRSR